MAFVTAYFDESYANPNPTVYTVAGYISTDRRWVKFQKAWMGLLNKHVLTRWCEVYGPEKRIFFHMKEFDNPHSKIYGDWPVKKKIWFLKELHKVIKKAYLRSFSSGVVVADYNNLSDAEKFAIGSPHVCAAINCVKQVGIWADKENREQPILYVFERGTVNDNVLMSVFDNTMSQSAKEYYRMEKAALGDKRDMPQLQAADILAFETRKEVERELDNPNQRKARESIKNLTIPDLDEWFYVNEVELRKIFDHTKMQETMESEAFKTSIAAHADWKPKI
ncbi:MAG: DUF3800 domain-containing protein [Pyrinomonadaceae bacterium]